MEEPINQEQNINIEKSVEKKSTFFTPLTIALLIIILIPVFLLVYAEIVMYKESRKLRLLQKVELEKKQRDALLNSFDASTGGISSYTGVGRDKYLKNLDSELNNPDVSTTSEKILLLRKAYTITSPSPNQTPEEKEKVKLEVSKIYNDIIESKDTDNDYYKDIAVLGYLKFFVEMGYNPTFVELLPKELSKSYDLYLKKGYDKQLAAMLVFNNLRKFLTPFSKTSTLDGATPKTIVINLEKDDINFILYSVKNKAQMLRSFRKEINIDDYRLLMNELNVELKSFVGSKEKIYQSYSPPAFELQTSYAYAYDIYNSYVNTKITEEINTSINQNYEDLLTTLKETKYTEDSLKNFLVIRDIQVSLWYLDSLQRRYGSLVDIKKRNDLVERILDNIASSSVVKNYFTAFFKNTYNGSNSWLGRNVTFAGLAKTNKEVYDYMISIGVSASDIRK